MANLVFLAGALVRPPELRYTVKGVAVLEATLGGVSAKGERERTWYCRVRLLGGHAEAIADRLEVGALLLGEGRLEYRQWEQGGEKRSELQVVLNRLGFLEREGREVRVDARGQPLLLNALNLALLSGNLTRDPELRHTPQGTPVARFGLAVNEWRQGEERAHFVEVQAWRHLAERVGRMRRGQGVMLSGGLFAESWLGSDGVKRYRLFVEADQVWERAWLTSPGLHKEAGLDVPEDALPF